MLLRLKPFWYKLRYSIAAEEYEVDGEESRVRLERCCGEYRGRERLCGETENLRCLIIQADFELEI